MAEDRDGKTIAAEGGGDVAARIRRFRSDAGLTQQALAAFLGVSQRTVSRWERGVDRPSAGLLDRLSTLVGDGDAGRLPAVYEAVRSAAVPLALVDGQGRVLVASPSYQAATSEIPAAAPAPAGPAPGERPPLVLVVEDDEAVLKATCAVLKHWQFLSVGVTDGRSAIDLVATGEVLPDVVLVDVLLPGGMDGLEAAATLRRHLPGLPVLVITGETSADSLRRIAEAGFAAVTKPVDPQQVRMALMALLPEKMTRRDEDEAGGL